MNTCSFCRIIARQAPGDIIDEHDRVITFLSLENPPLVVPKQHIAGMYSLDEVTGHAMMSPLIKIAKTVKTRMACDGVAITPANEPAAGQDVFHLHVHVYPRWHTRPQQMQHVDETARMALSEQLKNVG